MPIKRSKIAKPHKHEFAGLCIRKIVFFRLVLDIVWLSKCFHTTVPGILTTPWIMGVTSHQISLCLSDAANAKAEVVSTVVSNILFARFPTVE